MWLVVLSQTYEVNSICACFLSIPLSWHVLLFIPFVANQQLWMKPSWTEGFCWPLDRIQSEDCSLQLSQPAAHSFTVAHGERDEGECEGRGELGRFMQDQSCLSFMRLSHILTTFNHHHQATVTAKNEKDEEEKQQEMIMHPFMLHFSLSSLLSIHQFINYNHVDWEVCSFCSLWQSKWVAFEVWYQ